MYEQVYCARGEWANRIKECQLDLEACPRAGRGSDPWADRTLTATMAACTKRAGGHPSCPSVDNSAPPQRIGDHVVSARRLISHHGIYVGNGQVIHYDGLASGLQAGPVKVSRLEDFLADHPYKVREYKTRRYSGEESVERARARLGEDLYHPIFNNCEHFVTWCITGKTRSTQVDLLFGLTGGFWGLLLGRSGTALHALYRRIRARFQRSQSSLAVPRQRSDRRVE